MPTDVRAELLSNVQPNHWVALSAAEDRIIAVAATFQEVSDAVDAEGESDAVLVLVPEDWSPRIL